MSTIAPAPPRPPQEDLEALIKEARRRARRRRLAFAAATLLAAVVGGGVYAIVAFTGGGSSTSVPQGFHLVQAKGPVAHARIAQYLPRRPTVIDLASGRERRVPFVVEEWWDRKSGLDRAKLTIDGRVQGDTVGQSCQPKPRFCFSLPLPFDLARKGLSWPLDEKRFRVLGSGTFRGREVIWVKSPRHEPGRREGRPLGLRRAQPRGRRQTLELWTSRRGLHAPARPTCGALLVRRAGGRGRAAFVPAFAAAGHGQSLVQPARRSA
jgi:hypothetical protein